MYNRKKLTKDGKKLTMKAFIDEMTRDFEEGRDCVVTDEHKTWTQYARDWKGKEKEMEGMEGQATTSDAQTILTAEERLMYSEAHWDMVRVARDGMTTDGRTVSTDGQPLVTDEQTTTVMTAEHITGTDVHLTETDGQMTTTMMVEQMMATVVDELPLVEEVDPLALSPTALGATSGDFSISLHPEVVTFLASPIFAEQDQQEQQEVQVVQEADGGCDTDSAESTGGIGRRVVGRKRAVVVDDESDMSIVSITSADDGSSIATASSSRLTRSKGVKRRLEPVEEKERTEEEGSSEEKKGKKKGKRKGVGRKDTPVEEENVGEDGEPKGIFDHDLEDMSSEVLGGAIIDWANTVEDIRSKSKNMQGKLSGMMKKSVAKIKEGAALLVVRSMAKGDPEFLRLRNTELVVQLREAERENARLQEQLRKKSPEMPSPPRKKKKEKAARTDVMGVDLVDLVDPDVDSPSIEEFPPLPQRTPRSGVALDGSRKRTGPRIVSDVQVAPPFIERRNVRVATPAESGSEAEWRVAAGSRRRGRVKGVNPPPPVPPPFSHPSSLPAPPAKGRTPVRLQQPKVRLPKPPVSSAVTITGRSEGFSYATALKSAREHIKLEDLGITTTRVRKALNGGILIEVSGENSRLKAEELVTQLRTVLKDSAAISCPVKKRELTVVGFDESVTTEDIVEELSRIGGCPSTDIKMGPIRTMNNGLGTVWVQLPVAAAVKVAEVGRIRVGWTMARVELLNVRPLQCYKCWSFGHVQTTCRSAVDRRGSCFRCGQKGHVASTCTNPVHCAVCQDAGLVASHRLGSPQCAAQEHQAPKK